ncbi:pseudouridine synthase [Paenimyroides aestuarii]|uniref:Pseudouridine synthase n=1 Tax=Paenimyroides aestuarii TaxID=2968490 RepID=A0ABY5NS51_9FLAO|nr:pseudouridine synthase [Paenimyroides aestuarii]UUV21194.1 pseudouridine synthase [Paenimyroides aestuarii]
MHKHFLLYKPPGYISQFVYEKKRYKKKLGDLYNFPEGTMAIGRLDENSEGLLMLTTNGKISEAIRSAHYEKQYIVQVDGLIDATAIEKLKKGVEIGVKGVRVTTKECDAAAIKKPDYVGEGYRIRSDRHGPTSWLTITLTQGKFRQVRKMTAAVGFPTLRLIRIRIGNWTLEGMNVGEVVQIQL